MSMIGKLMEEKQQFVIFNYVTTKTKQILTNFSLQLQHMDQGGKKWKFMYLIEIIGNQYILIQTKQLLVMMNLYRSQDISKVIKFTLRHQLIILQSRLKILIQIIFKNLKIYLNSLSLSQNKRNSINKTTAQSLLKKIHLSFFRCRMMRYFSVKNRIV